MPSGGGAKNLYLPSGQPVSWSLRNMVRRLAPFAFDLWQHRGLLWQFTQRQIELRHKGSHLGLFWALLQPLLMLALYLLVFGYILEGKFGAKPDETRADFGLGIFFGLVLFHVFAEVLTVSSTVIVSQPNFVKKVVFPLEVLPAANVGAAFFHLAIGLGLALAGVALFGPGLGLTSLWLPVILLPVLLLLLGLGWLLAALGVFLRDLNPLTQFLSLVLMFSSAVFYSAQKIPPDAWVYMRFNPVLLAIQAVRDAALWQRPLHPGHLLYLWAAGLAACYVGHAVFRRLKPAFADVL
ncbi:MAG: sugar ABC transporter permease [Opitutus sp.]|nr:sugar ABC transporter permease [Opitutus sp.]